MNYVPKLVDPLISALCLWFKKYKTIYARFTKSSQSLISLSLSIHLSLSPPLSLSLVLSISLSPSLALAISLSLSLALAISLSLSINLSVYLSVYPSIYQRRRQPRPLDGEETGKVRKEGPQPTTAAAAWGRRSRVADGGLWRKRTQQARSRERHTDGTLGERKKERDS